MGSGIAQVVATAGLEVTVVDVSDAGLERARERIGRSLGRFVKSERLTPGDADAALGRLALSTDLEAAGAGAEHVIECVVEDLDVKADVLGRLDAFARRWSP